MLNDALTLLVVAELLLALLIQTHPRAFAIRDVMHGRYHGTALQHADGRRLDAATAAHVVAARAAFDDAVGARAS